METLKKPMSLQEFYDKHKESHDLIKELMKLIGENQYYEYRKVHGTKCDICDRPLTEEERQSVRPDSFNFTCTDHRFYHNYFNRDMVRVELGFPQTPKRWSEINY